MDIREYFQKEQKGFYKIIAKTLTAERRKQLYDAINDWQLKKIENMKTIAQQLGIKEFPFIIKDEKGNEIYYEYSDGSWFKYESDAKGNLIYSEHSDGSWFKREFDAEGNIIYLEDSDGYIKDNRNIPEYTIEELVEKIGNFKLKTK